MAERAAVRLDLGRVVGAVHQIVEIAAILKVRNFEIFRIRESAKV
jgi:hypothetical protein